MGVGVFNSFSKNFVDPYSDIGNIAKKYNIIAYEPVIVETPKFMSRSWLKNMMVSSFINTTQPIDTENTASVLLKVHQAEPTQNLYLLAFPEDSPIASIQRELEQLEIVKYVEPNYEVELQSTTKVNLPFSRPAVNSNTVAANQPTQDEQVYKVAIIDSGVDRSHIDFAGKKIIAKSLIGNNEDVVGHGTHLAGIILGIAPEVTLYSYKFTDGKVGRLSDVIRAMHMANKDNVNLVNLSLGLPTRSYALQETVELLSNNNITVVAAAGNLNANIEFYPAAFDKVISVGGLNTAGSKLASSNFGSWIDYSILGQNIYSTSPKQEYSYLSGTSQSAAKVSGLIARYYLDPSLQTQTLEDFLASQKFEREDNYKELLGVRLQK